MSISGKWKLCVDTKRLCCAHDEAGHTLYKTLALSIWMKQLPPWTIVCKTQIALVFCNIFKAASFSCYVIVTTKHFELMY